uniref:Microtubule-associated serine/threonine-protein kinase pre-PK domain-containing protein n=1 Tax=Meloidogyne javanica TaxID=6303 RepID=A0A915MF11_MELJA
MNRKGIEERKRDCKGVSLSIFKSTSFESEFNPDEFYQLLGDAEVAVREQLGSGSARVPDLPQYILTKLGLNKNLSSLEKNIGEQTGDGAGEEDEEEFRQNKGQKDAQLTAQGFFNFC